jgi:hypothetical protein
LPGSGIRLPRHLRRAGVLAARHAGVPVAH